MSEPVRLKTALHSMTTKYLVALGFVALVSLGSFLGLQASIRAERASAAVINLSGRQRMLSQRVAQYALRLAVAPSEGGRAELERALELMSTSHRALLAGTVRQDVTAPPSPDVLEMYLQAPLAVDAQVQAYLSHARAFLDAPTPTLADPDLQAVLASTDDLLYALDRVVLQYEHEAERANSALRALAAVVLAVTLLSLALSALFIFKPMTRAVRRAAAERLDSLRSAETALRRVEALYRVADTVSRADSVQAVLQGIVGETVDMLKADRVLLVTVDLNARSLHHVEVGGPSAARVPPTSFEELWEGLSGWVLRTGETVHSPGGARDPRESDRTAGTRAASESSEVLVAPLQVRGECFGTLSAIRNPGTAAFSSSDTALLAAVASQAAVALKSALAAQERDRLASEFEAIFKAMPDAVVFADASRRIRTVNPAAETMFGYSNATLQGQTTDRLYATTADFAAQGEQRYHAAASGTSSYEMHYRSESGRDFLGETVGTAVRSGDTLLGYVGIIRDVTVERAAAREREAEQVFLQAVLESVDDGIVACDANGRLILFNRATRDLHGLSADASLEPSEWVGHYDLYRADGVTPLGEDEIPLLRAFEGGDLVDTELVIAPADRPPRTVKARGRALYDADGAKLGAVVAMHDLSEQRRVEAYNRQWSERVQLLYDVSTQADLEPGDQINRALELTTGLLALEFGVLSRVEGESYTVTHLHDDSGTLQVGAVHKLGETYCSLAIRRDDVVGIHHMAEHREREHPCYGLFGLEAYIGIPVKVGGELWGVLGFSSSVPHAAFTDADAELLRLLGQFVSAALERQTSSAALQRYAEELERSNSALAQRNRTIGLLSSMSELLQAADTFSEAFSVVEHYAKSMFAPLGGALLWAGGTEILENVLSWGEVSEQRAQGSSAQGSNAQGSNAPNSARQDCWALRLGRLHRADAAGGPRCGHSTPGTDHLCVPLMAHNETLGVLYLQAPSTPKAGSLLSTELESLALAFGEGLAVTLANLQLRESLKQQSIRDPLTGLFNRRYLEETLERELHRSVRAGRPLSFIMFDIDHFKTFNDTFGHEAGDHVLREVAALAGTMVRKEDIACRYGGEEFALILPDATEAVALARAEKLCAAARELHLTFKGRALGHITLSLGVVTVACGSDLGSVVGLSDAALYRAKRAGRDRVEVAVVPGDGTAHSLVASP